MKARKLSVWLLVAVVAVACMAFGAVGCQSSGGYSGGGAYSGGGDGHAGHSH